jgi:anti-sigma factor RsiW
MLKCTRAKTRLNDYLIGALSGLQAAQLAEHLRECAACRREYEALKTIQAMLRGAVIPSGEAARERVLARFRQAVAVETAPRAAGRLRLRPVQTMLSVAAAAAVLWIAVLMTASNRAVEPAAPEVPTTQASLMPSPGEINEMIALHAAQSPAVLSGRSEAQQDDLAEANARLEPASLEEAP